MAPRRFYQETVHGGPWGAVAGCGWRVWRLDVVGRGGGLGAVGRGAVYARLTVKLRCTVQ